MLKRVLTSKRTIVVTAITIVAVLLYALGVKFIFLPVLIGVSVWWLPMPRIFTSWFGRTIVAFLLTLALLQLGASLQFLIIPKSDFVDLAIIVWLLHMAIWLCTPQRQSQKLKIMSSSDVCGLLVVVCFLLPFTPILLGHSSIRRIAEIGSVQAIDATNHYAIIAELTQAQHLNYAPGYYLPKGFHIADGFMQNTLFKSQYSLGWSANVWLYFIDYLVAGSMLGYLLYFLCISWLKSLNNKLVPDGWSWPKLLAAACLAPPLAILYLYPFISEGFLSYFYVCITLVCGLLFLSELKSSVKTNKDSLDLRKDTYGRWNLTAFLILLFGASATWPLLIPPFVLIGGIFLLPSRLHWKVFVQRVFNFGAIPVVIAFAVQLIPLYFQFKYSSSSTSQSINLSGGLTQFHPYVLLLGFIILVAVLVSSKVEEAYRRMLGNIFMPLFAFLALLMFFQYFTTGQILYYVIKVSLLVEMLLLVLGIASLIWVFVSSKLYEAHFAWLLPVVPMLVILLLVSNLSNPLGSTRDLFRHQSNDVIPQYLDLDSATNAQLGLEGKIHDFNLTDLHYDVVKGKYFADMQVPYFADMLQYKGNHEDLLAAQCIGHIYSNLAFGTYSNAAQQLLIQQLHTCAVSVKSHGGTFYIVTDQTSVPYIKAIMGNQATIVID